MGTHRHETADTRELLEIESFARQQREHLEVRNDPVEQILEPARFPLERPIAPVRAGCFRTRSDLSTHEAPRHDLRFG